MLAEQIRTVDRSRLSTQIGHIGKEIQPDVDTALAVCLELERNRPPKGKMFVLTLCRCCESDFRNNGYLLVKKGWQKIKENCDFCQTVKGLTFDIINLDWS